MSETTIQSVRGRQVWDSRGWPTVEAEVHLQGGAVGRAIAPAGASRGTHEAVDLRDGDDRFGGLGVIKAVRNINVLIVEQLMGMDAGDQGAVDAALIDLDATPNKAELGGNATVAVSMAVLHAAANAAGQPLWRYLAGDAATRLPLPEIQIFGGGAHAQRRIDIQDFMILTPGAESFRHALEISADVYRAAGQLLAETGRLSGTADEGGWWPDFDYNEQALEMLVRAIESAGLVPGDDVLIALDVAASEFFFNGRYRLGLEGRELDSDELIALLLGWIERYPILSVEDPLAEHDQRGMQDFTSAVGDRVQVVGDDYLVTDAGRVKNAIVDRACNAVLLKVNQAGTVTETRAALERARDAAWGTVVSARSGETEDITIAHLAVGWDAGQIKVGAIAHSERVAKWNELLRIEEALGAAARFAGRSALPIA